MTCWDLLDTDIEVSPWFHRGGCIEGGGRRAAVLLILGLQGQLEAFTVDDHSFEHALPWCEHNCQVLWPQKDLFIGVIINALTGFKPHILYTYIHIYIYLIIFALKKLISCYLWSWSLGLIALVLKLREAPWSTRRALADWRYVAQELDFNGQKFAKELCVGLACLRWISNVKRCCYWCPSTVLAQMEQPLEKWRWTVRTPPGQLLCAAFSEAPAGALLSNLTNVTTEGTLRYFSVAWPFIRSLMFTSCSTSLRCKVLMV